MKKSVAEIVDVIKGLVLLTDLWSACDDPIKPNASGSMRQLMKCLIHIDLYYA
jgi:hypothetical protein